MDPDIPPHINPKDVVAVYMRSPACKCRCEQKFKFLKSVTLKELQQSFSGIHAHQIIALPANEVVEDVIFTKDIEGKIALGRETNLIGDILTKNQLIFASYYRSRGLWLPVKYRTNDSNKCSICKRLQCPVLHKLQYGWSLVKACPDCIYTFTFMDDKGKQSGGVRRLPCVMCGNPNQCLFLSNTGVYSAVCDKNLSAEKSQCKTCLTPEKRQCSICKIPMDMIRRCNDCFTLYCSDRCEEQDDHKLHCISSVTSID